MSKLKIGFVGVGNMGQCAHLRNYATLPDCEVVAIAELRPKLRQLVAQKYNIPRTYASHEEMLAKEKLDGIVAAQFFLNHGQLIPRLLEAKIPVFTEKPLAGSIEMGKRIVEAAERNNTFVMVGYHKRSDRASQYARDVVRGFRDRRTIGKLKYIRILMPAGDWIAGGFSDLVQTDDPRPSLPHDPPPGDMNAESFKEYVSFVNYYIHQVNLMRFFLEEPYQVTHADPSGVLLVGKSESGICCTIEMSPYQTRIDWEESALIAFEHGYVKLSLPAPLAMNRAGRVEVYRDPREGTLPDRSEPTFPWIHAMRAQAENFLKAIRKEAPPPCDASEALQDLIVAREYLRLWKGV
ncbi:MAG TPA: Gfo/Idh/MocA family oxidoreductase [Tepidisphaeraceae bacterium]|jgi:predicted dehydrogenase|nr:Gfo/Idh/MocA family oxidoreductase [Tepidisphaeraceae bacterium]